MSASDITDLEADSCQGLKTPAVLLGIPKLLTLLYCLNVCVGIFIIIGAMLNLMPKVALVLLVYIPYSIGYIMWIVRVKHKKGAAYTLLLDGDGIWIGVIFFLIQSTGLIK